MWAPRYMLPLNISMVLSRDLKLGKTDTLITPPLASSFQEGYGIGVIRSFSSNSV
jgi:hypothetical protein